MRVKLTVTYVGTGFRGWASNKGHRTVQSTLTEAVRYVSGEKIEIIGASRTDSGAHAKCQVCHFDTTSTMPVDRWVNVLNKRLPADIAVTKSQKVADDFNSRFSVIDRHYRYRIYTGPRDPYRELFAYRYGYPLDLQKMQEAAKQLIGDHDFLAFTEELEPQVTNTRRELFKVGVKQVRNEVWVDIVGTAFLRGMMRRMSGAILEVGRGSRDVVEVSRLLQPEERLKYQWPVVLPAKGLCLMNIRYGRVPRDNRNNSALGREGDGSQDSFDQ